MNNSVKVFLDTAIQDRELESLTTTTLDMREVRAYLMHRLHLYLYRNQVHAPLRETGYTFGLSERQVARELEKYGYR